jgi:hypothetical protein
MKCWKCGDNLFGKPKINVRGCIYCYKCSKTEVAQREQFLRKQAKERYEYEMAIYKQAKYIHANEYAVWWKKRQAYIGSIENIGCGFVIGGTIALCLIINNYQKGEGFLGVIIGFIGLIIWVKISSYIVNKRNNEFCILNPEPKFVKVEPTLSGISPIDHSFIDHDGSSLDKKIYREEILRRDNLTCQVCGQKKRRTNLEVHHIIPRSKGGTDDSTNLITLCKYCHDREKWYEHIRKFPTTIGRSKRRRSR